MIENIPQQQIPTSTPQPVLNQPKSIIPMILALIIVALVSGGGVYFWQQGEINKLRTNQPQQTSYLSTQETPTHVPVLSPTTAYIKPTELETQSGWSNYKNTKNGISFDYPSNSFKISGDAPIKIENTILPPDDGGQAGTDNGWMYYEIEVTPVSPNTSVNDWVSQNWPNQDKSSQSNITVGGVKAIKFQNADFEPKANIYVFLIKGNNLFKISGHYLNFQDSSYYQQIKELWLTMADKFLGTIKLN